MKPVVQSAVRWGMAIGVANLIWLYVAYFLGLHTNGVMVFQGFMIVWLLLTVAGFFVGLRAVRRDNPSLRYLGGVAAGIVAAFASAIVAVIAQIGYFKVIHPAWPVVMAQQTRTHFTAQGLSADQVERMVGQARNYFTLSNYAVSSFFTALILGAVLSAIFMAFPRRTSNSQSIPN